MNETCELLKKSFYEDEWQRINNGAEIWRRKKDGVELWADNGTWFFFSGWRNNIHIPLLLRGYMAHHIKRGQNILATKRLLGGHRDH